MITFTGTARSLSTNAPIAGANILYFFEFNGVRRVAESTMTNSEGNLQVSYETQSYDLGLLRFGAKHPADPQWIYQGEVQIVDLYIQQTAQEFRVLPGKLSCNIG